jgi:hypothetical protein
VSESRGEGQPGSDSSPGGQPESSNQPENNGQPENSGPPVNSAANSGQPRVTSSPPGGPGGSSRSDGAPRSDSWSRSTDSSKSTGPSRSNGQPGGRSQPGRGSDPVADFQRWLMKAGARTMANQVADQVKRTIGQEKRRGSGDVWDTATTELPPDESLECQWCPVCQAARAARLSGPGLGAKLTGAGGVLASVVQDAFSAFEQVMKTQDQNHSAERTVVTPPTKPDRGDTAP